MTETEQARRARELGTELNIRFDRDGLIPAVATDAASGKVLMLAFMNAEAVEKTLATGQAHYYSRSRRQLWHKGATSGQTQAVRELRIDCDQDAIWLVVDQAGGGACHVGFPTCFYRRIRRGDDGTVHLERVEEGPAGR